MPRFSIVNSKIHRGSRSDDIRGCNCGWELRLGYGVAVSLAIFEAKRFFLLALELFVEWQVISFAGGYKPVALTFVDVGLGFPCALAAVYIIRKRQAHPICFESQKLFGYLLTLITICVAMNVVTMITIGHQVSVRQRSLARVFNSSMQLYVKSLSSKYAVDQIQLILQCCGHTYYDDWFLIDWQMVDYASREDMSRQSIISDEMYRDRGVPFSCCNFRVLRACVHSQMTDYDVDTVNPRGCAQVLSNVIVRIVFVAYVMTTMLVITQAILGFFIVRIAKKIRADERKFGAKKWKDSLQVASRPLVESASPFSSEEYISSRGKVKNVGNGAVVSGLSDLPNDSTSSGDAASRDTARIKPSAHSEHRLPRKKPGIKTTR